MINLLPYDTKKQIRAARMNLVLFRLIIILIFATVFLTLACSVTYYSLNVIKVSNESLAKNGQQKIISEAEIRLQETSLNNNLVTAKNILDRQVLYSIILTEIAVVLPNATVLDSISIDDSKFGTPINLKINARLANSEPKLKENFQKSQTFSNYSLISNAVNKNNSSDYPFTISISVIINKGVNQ